MFKHLRSNTGHGPIGIDAGRTGARLIQLGRRGDALCVLEAAAWSGEVDARVEYSGLLTPDQLHKRVERLAQRPFQGREAICALNPPEAELHLLELPEATQSMDESSLRDAANWEIQRLSAIPAENLQSATWVLPPSRKARSGLMGVAAGRDDVMRLVDLCGAARLDCRRVDVSACALAGFVWELRDRPLGEVWGILDFAAQHTRLTICIEDTAVLVRCFEIGGVNWTQQIAEHLSLSPVAAERYKRDFGLPRDDVVDDLEADVIQKPGGVVSGQDFARVTADVLDGDLQRLLKETERSYEFILQWGEERVPGPLLLVGGGALMPGLPDHLQDRLGIDVKPLSEWPSESVPTIQESLRGIETLETCALACGLSLQGMRAEVSCPA